jgi:hypothetical protein
MAADAASEAMATAQMRWRRTTCSRVADAPIVANVKSGSFFVCYGRGAVGSSLVVRAGGWLEASMRLRARLRGVLPAGVRGHRFPQREQATDMTLAALTRALSLQNSSGKYAKLMR